MSAVQTSSHAPTGAVSARPVALLAGATALAFAAEAVVAALFPADIADHAVGAGRVSEALAGVAFLLAAAAMAGAARAAGRPAAWLFVPAMLGAGAMGVAQLDIAARGQEWSEGVVTVIVLLALVGLLLAGVAGARARVWPWWVAGALAAVVPVLFVVPSPFNSMVIAALWIAVAAVTRQRH